MKLKLFVAGMLSMFLIFTACDDDNGVSIIDIDEPDTEEPGDDEEPELDPLLIGSWKMDPTAGSLAVGPSADDLSWFAVSAGDVAARDCFYDDLYTFNEDGSFENELGDETWVEGWQEGVEEEGCGAPVPPHDGSEAGTWSADGESVTVSGEGIYLGLAKVHNGGEDGNPSGDTITYDYVLSEDNTILEVTISGWLDDNPDATWYYRLTNDLDASGGDDSDDDGDDEEKTIIDNVEIDFEGEEPEFRVFGGTDDQGAGVEYSVIDNPDASGENTSETVGSLLDPDQSVFYTGTASTLDGYISFETKSTFKVKVWSPVDGAVIKFKLEDSADPSISAEVDQNISEASTWEVLTYEFSAEDSEKFDTVVIFFNFDPNGDQSPKNGENTYFFDDIILE